MNFTKNTNKIKTIIIGGVGRSGTTIMGKIVGSLKNIEYFYEPITLLKLISHFEDIEKPVWKDLFETCLHKDLLINSLAGRNMNFNSGDDSYIYNIKDRNEVGNRLKRSFRRMELIESAETKIPSFKLTDLIIKIPEIQGIIPNICTIVMVRNPNDTINSLVKKEWFTDANLNPVNPPPVMDFNIINNFRIPKFVPKEDYELWINANEIERCAYYFIRINEILINNKKSLSFVSYDELIKYPKHILKNICNKFNLSEGKKTSEIISEVKYRDRERRNLLANLRENFIDRIRVIEMEMRTLGLTN